ncbi:hypothetical protein [Paenibacillus hexagrammi]|uniref:Uncharacterized protein n=1 Tax=Paenibacillus hexagrammi TaxID=2908839 RepID=A0ABY3SP27_9BACL|nr:hypothetical protein [Paenibacillus sp. YPD9-1]UJF35688.1 hypothetical protein L0M14_11710 [Paenibacillus sp. YPD9-1]
MKWKPILLSFMIITTLFEIAPDKTSAHVTPNNEVSIEFQADKKLFNDYGISDSDIIKLGSFAEILQNFIQNEHISKENAVQIKEDYLKPITSKTRRYNVQSGMVITETELSQEVEQKKNIIRIKR